MTGLSYLKSLRLRKLDDGVPIWLFSDLIGLTFGDFSIRDGMGEKLYRCLDELFLGRMFAISSDMFKEFVEEEFKQFNPKLVFNAILGEAKTIQRIF